MKRVCLQHNSRGDDACPVCQSALRWRKSGTNKWTPCDYIPVLFCFSIDGSERVLYKGEIITEIKILRKRNAAEFTGKQLLYGLEPHVFTCNRSIIRQKGSVNYMQIASKDGSVQVCGIVGKDADFKIVGDSQKELCKFILKVGEKPNPDGSSKPIPIWCNCVARRDIARGCSGFKKGNSVFAIGKINTREYQGKEYKDLVLEFAISMAGSANNLANIPVKPEEKAPETFQEIEDPDDLPF